MRLNSFSSILAFIVMLVIFSCSKDPVKGPKGDPGDPGGGGNSGIQSTDIFTISSLQWQKTVDSSWKYIFNSTLLTQDIVDKGIVKVFVLNGSSWWELPFTEGDLFTQFGFTLGSVDLVFADIHGGLPERPVSKSYRMVVISALAREKYVGTDWSDYESIMKLANKTSNINSN